MHIIKHFSSEFTPCGCDTSRLRHVASVPATQVKWRQEVDGVELTCIDCGSSWFLEGVFAKGRNLHLSASHPAEKARRRAAA